MPQVDNDSDVTRRCEACFWGVHGNLREQYKPLHGSSDSLWQAVCENALLLAETERQAILMPGNTHASL